MPRQWHDRHSLSAIEDDGERNFYRSIIADKKPYFMRYIYPALMKQYNTYIKNTNENALRRFQMTVPELLAQPYQDLSDEQKEFLRYYEIKMPVGTHDCIMNKICRRFEDEFDGYVSKGKREAPFDYNILKSSASYTSTQYYTVKRLCSAYSKQVQNYKMFARYERVDKAESSAELTAMMDEFRRECHQACTDARALCNIILDICYSQGATRRLAWELCGTEIVQNLLERNGNVLRYPSMCGDGDIEYCGGRYELRMRKVEAGE